MAAFSTRAYNVPVPPTLTSVQCRFLLLTASISTAASSLRRFTRRSCIGRGDWSTAGHVHIKHGCYRRFERVTAVAQTIARARYLRALASAGARVCTLYLLLPLIACRATIGFIFFCPLFFSQRFFFVGRHPHTRLAENIPHTHARHSTVPPPSTNTYRLCHSLPHNDNDTFQ